MEEPIMEEEDSLPYQCKQCSDKFKITADLQKHFRQTHRIGRIVLSDGDGDDNSSSSKSMKNDDYGSGSETSSFEEDSSDCDYDASASESESEGRQLICGSCKHICDTYDPIISHLIQLSRTGNGIMKCPFCVKVQLDTIVIKEEPTPISVPASMKRAKSPSPECGPIFMRIPPGPPPSENLTTRRRTRFLHNRRKVLQPMQLLEGSQAQREVVEEGKPKRGLPSKIIWGRRPIVKKPVQRRLSEVQLQLTLERCFQRIKPG